MGNESWFPHERATMREITFRIGGETPEDEKRFEDAIDLAVEKLHSEHPNVAYIVGYSPPTTLGQER